MTDILLHQYDSSPFSEKVRVCLGIKGLAWAAVDQPVIMPKPQLIPLTGGYRRIPVMQIGADMYCDSQLIVRELERRFPEPTLFPGGRSLLDYASALWTDREMFQAAVAVIFAGLGDKVPPEFIKDREALSGRPFDPAAMRAAVPMMTQKLRAHAALISERLQDGVPFLAGERPGLLDANAYYNLWFVRSAFRAATPAFDDLPQIGNWMERVRAIGHGRRSELSAAQALKVAREASPQTIAAGADELLGRMVVIAAEDYGRDPIEGTLIAASDTQVTILRRDAALGDVAVHFPRIGFHLRERAAE
jgi:glutathione S-transferase